MYILSIQGKYCNAKDYYNYNIDTFLLCGRIEFYMFYNFYIKINIQRIKFKQRTPATSYTPLAYIKVLFHRVTSCVMR